MGGVVTVTETDAIRHMRASPYDQIIVWDYFDGEKEGLARSSRSGRAYYFSLLWCDDSQDWRLFRMAAIDDATFWNALSEVESKPDVNKGFYLLAASQRSIGLVESSQACHFVFGKNLRGEICEADVTGD